MKEVNNYRETFFRKLLFFWFKEAEGDLADEWCPPWVAAKPKKLEDFVPRLVVRHLPGQTLIVVPSVTTLQVPRVPEGKINERTMEQVGEVLNSPVVEDDDHLLVFGNALGHRSYVVHSRLHVCPGASQITLIAMSLLWVYHDTSSFGVQRYKEFLEKPHNLSFLTCFTKFSRITGGEWGFVSLAKYYTFSVVSARRSSSRNWLSVCEPTSRISLA